MGTNEIIFLIIAIAFVALVIFLIILIVKANQTLAKVNNILGSVQTHLQPTDGDQKNLLENVNELSANVVHKMKCLDPLFHVVSNVGEGLEFKTNAFKEKMFWKSIQDNWKSIQDKMGGNIEREPTSGSSDIVDCAVMGLNLWKKYKEKN